MKKILTIAAFFVFAGAAQAQLMGGSISDHQGYNTMNSGMENWASLNPHHPSSSNDSVAPSQGNISGQNPGEFVPSTFEGYKEAVADAKANANKKPLTLADIARQAQADKKATEPKTAMVLEQDSDGKLVVANPKKQ